MAATFTEAARETLLTADPLAKADAATRLYGQWIADGFAVLGDSPMPDRPGRPAAPPLLAPRDMPRRRKAGKAHTRIALLHAVAHIELNAVDLALDMAGRFGPLIADKAFIGDWLAVAADEARHFSLLSGRLENLGATYGDLPAHDGLWQAAEDTSHDVMARLAVAHMVLEARGLDVTPAMIERFERTGDADSAAILKVIYQDEIGHVRTGSKWFRTLGPTDSDQRDQLWRTLVKQNFKGQLKRPFNEPARESALMAPTLYLPLADDG